LQIGLLNSGSRAVGTVSLTILFYMPRIRSVGEAREVVAQKKRKCC